MWCENVPGFHRKANTHLAAVETLSLRLGVCCGKAGREEAGALVRGEGSEGQPWRVNWSQALCCSCLPESGVVPPALLGQLGRVKLRPTSVCTGFCLCARGTPSREGSRGGRGSALTSGLWESPGRTASVRHVKETSARCPAPQHNLNGRIFSTCSRVWGLVTQVGLLWGSSGGSGSQSSPLCGRQSPSHSDSPRPALG